MSLRPQSFNEYIGQERLRRNLRLAINAAKKRSEVLRLLAKDASTRKIDIDFPYEQLEYKEAYKRWLDAWREI